VRKEAQRLVAAPRVALEVAGVCRAATLRGAAVMLAAKDPGPASANVRPQAVVRV